jgi:hypothetical protein
LRGDPARRCGLDCAVAEQLDVDCNGDPARGRVDAGVPGGRLDPFARVELDRYQARRLVDGYWSTDNDLCRAILHVLDEDEEDEEG